MGKAVNETLMLSGHYEKGNVDENVNQKVHVKTLDLLYPFLSLLITRFLFLVDFHYFQDLDC